jgi:hypothetical protein
LPDLPDYWTDAVGGRAEKEVKKMIQDGLVEPCPLNIRLDHLYTVARLKPLLKERGLAVSGRKADLIERLVEIDPVALDTLTAKAGLHQCTPAGRKIAERFEIYLSNERTDAEREVLDHIVQRDFRAASERMARFEAVQVFPRGLEIDWARYEPSSDVEELKALFGGVPKLLDGLAPELLEPFRLCAAMMLLWGENSAQRWFDETPETGLRLEAQACILMLAAFAQHERTMASYRKAKIGKVEILGGDDEYSCPRCRALGGKVFRLSKTPELPYPRCSCELGCRCTTIAADLG